MSVATDADVVPEEDASKPTKKELKAMAMKVVVAPKALAMKVLGIQRLWQ